MNALRAAVLIGLSLSIGWGVRGNFEHEYGAMLPGALAAMAGVLMLGRGQWLPRISYFGFFGGLGWAFGGSISYMQVIAYTHSGHLPSVYYGFAGLFAIGFVWAGMADERGITLEQIQADTLTNWPNAFHLFPQHVGWVIGLTLGVILHFSRHGRFRSGSGLLICMVAGWFLGFLAMPVLLGFGGAGLRMTPPRGDNWAGIVGVWVACVWWLVSHGYIRVVYAGILSGLVGGFGFSAASCFKLMLVALGNPNLTTDAAAIEKWRFWQQSNWHSFLEQSYGLINGLGIFLALYWLQKFSSRFSDDRLPSRARWTQWFSVAFVLFGVSFFNMRKNVPTWLEGQAMPESMRMPGFENIVLPAHVWFTILYACLSAMGFWLLRSHQSRPIEWIPSNWIGRGQLMYLVFLWVVVIMNFERALVRFDESRLLTEGVIFANAVLATWMISCWPLSASHAYRSRVHTQQVPQQSVRWLPLGLFAAFIISLSAVAMPASIRAIYGDQHAGHAGLQKRFGPDALWRTTPIFKSKRHS